MKVTRYLAHQTYHNLLWYIVLNWRF